VRLLIILGVMSTAQLLAQGDISNMPSAKTFALMHETIGGTGPELLGPETRELITESWDKAVPVKGPEGALIDLLRSVRFPIPGVSFSNLALVSKRVGSDTVRGFVLVFRLPNLRKPKLSLTHH
jgi:hypothetical protein